MTADRTAGSAAVSKEIHAIGLSYQTFQSPSHANLEVLKNLEIRTSNPDYLLESTLYLISALCCTLLLLFLHLGSFSSCGCLGAPTILWWWGGSQSHQDTPGWRLSLALPPFPSQNSFDELNLAVMSTDFSLFLHTFQNCLAI